MYRIIGGDQKEYGLVSAEDLRKWIAEGRLNAQTPAKAEGDEAFRPLGGFPEFADALAAAAGAAELPPAPATVVPPDLLGRDYNLDIGGCIGSGWTLLKDNFSLLFVGVLIYFLIEGAIAGLGVIPIIGPLFSIANLFIAGPLMGGVFYIFIQAIRGGPAEIGDVFAGFRRAFLQLFLGYLVPALLGGLCLIPVGIVALFSVFPALAQHQPLPPPESVLLTLVPVFLICLVPMVYLQISWSFTLPLIVDKQMDFWPAMKTSWKMVNKHWWLVFGLFVLVGLLNVVGVLLCCIGLLFTVPVGFGALMYAYETIFSAAQTQTG
ncbi:MAG: glycerophosphoryl diester phosphodiesterase membrane domain-containing protein [Verrucomicrobiota bacterium]